MKDLYSEILKKLLKEADNTLERLGIRFYNYQPYSFPPDLSSLNKEEHDKVIDDLRKNRVGLLDYLQFVDTMKDEPIYNSILLKLVKSNKSKVEFTLDQDSMMKYKGLAALQKFKSFYDKYKSIFPEWATENKRLYDDVIKAMKPTFN